LVGSFLQGLAVFNGIGGVVVGNIDEYFYRDVFEGFYLV